MTSLARAPGVSGSLHMQQRKALAYALRSIRRSHGRAEAMKYLRHRQYWALSRAQWG